MIGTETNQQRDSIVANIIALAKLYVEDLGNVSGGSLHIVLSDENLNDGCVRFCLQYAEEAQDWVGVALAKCLLELNEDERKQVYLAIHWRFPL